MTTFIPALTLPSQVFASPAVSIILPVACGTGIGFAISPKRTQETYLALKQPPYRPPEWIFGPVWTVLYSLMGYGAYRAWHTGSASVNPSVRDLAKHGATLYTIQLGLNLIWTPLYFGFKRPIEASVDIVALTATTAYLASVWAQVDEVAAWCLAPYLGWLGFASYLCIGSGYLNSWSFKDKEKRMPPSGRDTTFVNEKKSS